MGYIIYYWNQKDYTQLYNLWYQIFEDSKGFCDYYFKNKLLDNRIIVLEQNKSVISMLHLNPYKISLNWIEINSEYIVGVCTKPEYRGKGFLKQIMTKALTDLYNENTEFTFLTTVDENIYTHYNFRYISSYFNSQLTKIKTEINKNISPVELTSDLFDEFLNYYNNKMKTEFNCFVVRDNYYLERLIKEMKCENGFIKVFYKDNCIKGYIMFYINSNIQIREIIYDIDIAEDIIAYLQTLINTKNNIQIAYSCNNYLEYILNDYFKVYSELKPYFMGRLVYIQSFLQRIKLATPITINMSIKDNVIEQNNKTFKWNIGTCTTLTETSEEDIIIDIGTLTQWLFGYIHIDVLISLKQIEIKNINIIDNLRLVPVYRKVFINEVV